MRKFGIAIFIVSACSAWASQSMAKVDAPAQDWQVNSLGGITSIKYGVPYDPTNTLLKTVTSSLSVVKVPKKAISMKKEDAAETPSPAEAILKVFVDERKDGKCWVGLSVTQKSQLARNSSISYGAKTYRIGTLTTGKEANAAVKELCEKFAQDLNSQAK